jgi:hypothetical protein
MYLWIDSGCDFRVLSSTSLLSRPFDMSTAVPFTEELRHQYDAEVLCLPYNISPFRALDIARYIPTQDARVDDVFNFTPKSITPNLVRPVFRFVRLVIRYVSVCSISCLDPSLSSQLPCYHARHRHPLPAYGVYRSIQTQSMPFPPHIRQVSSI